MNIADYIDYLIDNRHKPTISLSHEFKLKEISRLIDMEFYNDSSKIVFSPALIEYLFESMIVNKYGDLDTGENAVIIYYINGYLLQFWIARNIFIIIEIPVLRMMIDDKNITIEKLLEYDMLERVMARMCGEYLYPETLNDFMKSCTDVGLELNWKL